MRRKHSRIQSDLNDIADKCQGENTRQTKRSWFGKIGFNSCQRDVPKLLATQESLEVLSNLLLCLLFKCEQTAIELARSWLIFIMSHLSYNFRGSPARICTANCKQSSPSKSALMAWCHISPQLYQSPQEMDEATASIVSSASNPAILFFLAV